MHNSFSIESRVMTRHLATCEQRSISVLSAFLAAFALALLLALALALSTRPRRCLRRLLSRGVAIGDSIAHLLLRRGRSGRRSRTAAVATQPQNHHQRVHA